MIAAYPFGGTKKVQVLTSTKDALTEDAINKALAKRRDIKLLKIESVNILATDN